VKIGAKRVLSLGCGKKIEVVDVFWVVDGIGRVAGM
jgi:hypothetical protein